MPQTSIKHFIKQFARINENQREFGQIKKAKTPRNQLIIKGLAHFESF